MTSIADKNLESWSDFPISEKILIALKENNLNKPLPIQIKSLKATLLKNKNVLGAAQTGSGKTLAYAIPVLNQIITQTSNCSSKLKAKICKSQSKKEDFELIGDDLVSVEDMIVDKQFESVKSPTESQEDEEGEDDDDDEDSNVHDSDEELEQSESKPNDIIVRICPESIILVPTRELAFQVKEEIDRIATYTDVSTCCLVGGLSQDKQIRKLRNIKPQIIIATPGRLFEIVQSDSIEYLNVQSIASISTLVIDEADRMIQKGHFEEMLKIIDILKESKAFRKKPQLQFKVYLYSATLTFLHELPSRFKINPMIAKDTRNTNSTKKKDKKYVDSKEHNKKNKIKQMLDLLGIVKLETAIIDLNDELSFGRPSAEQLTEMKINCVEKDKDLHLYYFLFHNQNKKIIVFCNSKTCLRRLSNVLKFLGYGTLKLHSDMDQKKRLSSLEKFRSRPSSILIATDIAARGLDIKNLDCVIHYQVPRTCESYIHRSGRTARLNRKGISLTLCDPKEVPAYRRLCNNINGGKELENYEVDVKLRLILKDRVDLAIQCDKIEHELREKKSQSNWFIKAAKDCDIELDRDDLRILGGRGKSREQNLESDAKKRRLLVQLEKRLKLLFKKPIRTRESVLQESIKSLKANDSYL